MSSLDYSQRWRERDSTWVSHRQVCDIKLIEAAPLPESGAKAFVLAHHYSGSYPAARCRVGIYERGELVGVAVFGIPAGPKVLKTWTGYVQDEAVELCRFVLLDEVGYNAESYALKLARRVLCEELPELRAGELQRPGAAPHHLRRDGAPWPRRHDLSGHQWLLPWTHHATHALSRREGPRDLGAHPAEGRATAARPRVRREAHHGGRRPRAHVRGVPKGVAQACAPWPAQGQAPWQPWLRVGPEARREVREFGVLPQASRPGAARSDLNKKNKKTPPSPTARILS